MRSLYVRHTTFNEKSMTSLNDLLKFVDGWQRYIYIAHIDGLKTDKEINHEKYSRYRRRQHGRLRDKRQHSTYVQSRVQIERNSYCFLRMYLQVRRPSILAKI